MLKRHFSLYITISLLIISATLAIIPLARAQTPTIFIAPADPGYVQGDLTPAPGTSTQWKINVSDIGAPGMIGHEFYLALDPQAFPDFKPAINGNFTSDASGWTPTVTVTRGTPTNGHYAADGNPSPGSGPGSYRMRANATGTQTASIVFLLESAPFAWTVGTPPEVLLSFAYTVSGNSFGTVSAGAASVGISIVKPDLTTQTLITSRTYNSAKPWSFNRTATAVGAFVQKGNYKLRLRSLITTAGTATTDYVEIKWDDIGLSLPPVSVSEGPFLTSDPQNVGKTMWSTRYMRFPTNNSLYVSDNLVGEPYTVVNPVQGSGMIANITLRADYGAAYLDLWGTILLEPGLFPPYTPTPMVHAVVDFWFDNRMTGDANSDKVVDVFDILAVKSRWGRSPASPDWIRAYDVNNDSIIDVFDILTIKANWGRTTP